jgi:hypothetical protein
MGTGMEVGMMTAHNTEATVMDGNFLRDATKGNEGLDPGRGIGQELIPTIGGSEGSRLWKDASLIGPPLDLKRLREGHQARRHLLVGPLVPPHQHVDRRRLYKSEGVRC